MRCFRPSGHLAFASGRPQGSWLQSWRKLLADRKRVHLCLVCWCSRNQWRGSENKSCVRAELNNGELLSCCAFLRSRKLRLPVNFLFSSLFTLSDSEARQRKNHKAVTSCQKDIVDEAVSDLLLPSVSWQPVYAAEGRPVTILRLRLRTNKERTLT